MNSLEVKKILFKGIEKVAQNVIKSYGPKGKSSFIRAKLGAYRITTDGVSIAKATHSSDPYEEMGCKLVHELTLRQDAVCGDGTTTATVLFYNIIKTMMQELELNDSEETKERLKKELDKSYDILDSLTPEFDEDKLKLCSIRSCNNEELGNLIYGLVKDVDVSGDIRIESTDKESYSEVVDGCQIIISPVSMMLSKNLREPRILVFHETLTSLKPILKIINTCASEDIGLIISAPDFDKSVISQFTTMVQQSSIKGNLIKPMLGLSLTDAFLDDLAYISDAKTIFPNDLESDIEIDKCGSISQFKQIQNNFIFMPSKDIVSKINELKKLKEDNSKDDYLQYVLEERLKFLSGKIGTLYIHADTSLEFDELKDKVTDSINSTRSAFKSGVIKSDTYKKLSKIAPEVSKVALASPSKLIREGGVSYDPILTIQSALAISLSLAEQWLNIEVLIDEGEDNGECNSL